MEKKEIKDITLSALALAVAFGIAFSGGFSAFSNLYSLGQAIVFSLIAVSSGFVLHEMGHRFAANKFNCRAEYQMWPGGLFLALALSLFGFVFAAPGAVVIYPRINLWGRAQEMSKKAYGIISAAGPILNLSLALVFIAMGTFYDSQLFALGKDINAWMAVFNLIPFMPFDGAKLMAWDRRIWLALAIVALIILFI